MKNFTLSINEDNPAVTLTAYLHEDAQEAIAGMDRPAVLVCPGGGYLGCSPREGEPVALRFYTMGYQAFVLRYSVYSDGDMMVPSRTLPPRPERQYPAALRDIGRAFLTVRAHAGEWRTDVERIALCGFSAGAHNCAMYGVYWNTPVLTAHFGVPAEQLRPAAAILGYGLYDYFLMRDGGPMSDPFAADMQAAFNTAYFGVPVPTDAQADMASPALHVGAHTPPMFLWATGADSLVPVENSTRMAGALAKAGVPFELHVFEEGMHGLSLADQSTADSQLSEDANAAQWVPLCERWLSKRFHLTLPARPFWMDMA